MLEHSKICAVHGIEQLNEQHSLFLLFSEFKLIELLKRNRDANIFYAVMLSDTFAFVVSIELAGMALCRFKTSKIGESLS